ncbi:hypothetical protein LXL04_001481 [Taraxacum kok-saghyz]
MGPCCYAHRILQPIPTQTLLLRRLLPRSQLPVTISGGPLSQSSFCSDVLYRDLLSPDANHSAPTSSVAILFLPTQKLLCPNIRFLIIKNFSLSDFGFVAQRLLSMAENNKIEEAYVLEIAPMLGRNQWVHIEKTWMSPLWYLWTPWKDLQKSRTSRF